MDYKIVKKPSFKIVGKSEKFEFDTFAKESPKFWKDYVRSDQFQRLIQINEGRPGPITEAPMLTAYFPKENGSREIFTDVLGLEVANFAGLDDFEVHSVPAATYAEFNCTYKTSMKTNQYIYEHWFSSEAFSRDSNKPDIAAYFPIPFKPLTEMRVRWWIPVVES